GSRGRASERRAPVTIRDTPRRWVARTAHDSRESRPDETIRVRAECPLLAVEQRPSGPSCRPPPRGRRGPCVPTDIGSPAPSTQRSPTHPPCTLQTSPPSGPHSTTEQTP